MKRLYVGYENSEDAASVEIRNDRLFPWLEARGYACVGKDEDEWRVPDEDVANVEHEVTQINAEYGTDRECFWAEEKGGA